MDRGQVSARRRALFRPMQPRCGCAAARQPATDRDTPCRSFFHPWLLGEASRDEAIPGIEENGEAYNA